MVLELSSVGKNNKILPLGKVAKAVSFGLGREVLRLSNHLVKNKSQGK
jgi:hypothetical protein